ncbi:TetR/AcrR family transcriptional regulator [Nonomuraea sp. NPDC050790]|uniref:TetR/AcrR family transcriptional regulator n=1 Tax=Nonomuraea sp. NPDC050790 TaxID=3364371 RepID=UPI003791772E
MSPGLRERKREQTRRHLTQVAMALFVERGFDAVTVAEVAEAAEVAVNTVYNHFPAKEDLVLPPREASPRRLAAIVAARPAGVSAARAVLDHLREEVRRREPAVGLSEGFAPVFLMMRAAPTLTARLEELGRQMSAELAAELEREHPADPLGARIAAWQLGALHALVYTEIGARVAAGQPPERIAAGVLALLEAAERTLGGPLLGYAVRKDDPSCSV